MASQSSRHSGLEVTDLSVSSKDIEGIDIIIHNMYCPGDDKVQPFTTFRKWTELSLDELMIDMAVMVERKLWALISVSGSKHSFVAIVGCPYTFDELTKKVWEGEKGGRWLGREL